MKNLLLAFLVLFLATSGVSCANNSNKQAKEAEAADTAEVVQPKYTSKMLISQCRKAYPKGEILAALPVVCDDGTEYGVCVIWYADDEDYSMEDPFCRMVTLKDGRVCSNKIVPLSDSDFDSHSKETKPIIVKIGNADYLYFGYQNWLSGNALPGYAEYVFSIYDFVHNKIYTHSVVGTNEFNDKNEVVRFKIETDHPMITSSKQEEPIADYLMERRNAFVDKFVTQKSRVDLECKQLLDDFTDNGYKDKFAKFNIPNAEPCWSLNKKVVQFKYVSNAVFVSKNQTIVDQVNGRGEYSAKMLRNLDYDDYSLYVVVKDKRKNKSAVAWVETMENSSADGVFGMALEGNKLIIKHDVSGYWNIVDLTSGAVTRRTVEH